MLDNNNDTRRFSYAEPILYRGNSYPSAKTDINDNGITREGRIFADANGDYYTLDANGNALPTMLTDTLPEVEITPTKQEMLSAAFNRYLTMSNDKAKVNNTPHREYNPHLRENALQGAKAHAQWDKDHPNLSAWRDAATMIPFGVAAIPLAGGLSETALGNIATRGLGIMANAVNNNAFLPWANTAMTSYFGAEGINDIRNNTFTPETAIKVASLVNPTASLLEKGAKEAWYSKWAQYPRYYAGKLYYGNDVELPTLYRKLNSLPTIENGKIVLTNPNSRFAYMDGTDSPVITNMTTDVPVRSHNAGNWDLADVLAYPGKTLLGKNVISTRPSDTFTFGDKITVSPSKVTFFSGSEDAVKAAQNMGMKAKVSEESKRILDAFNKAEEESTGLFNFNKIDGEGYSRGIQQLTRNTFKSPTIKDYKFMDWVFQPQYRSEVFPYRDLSKIKTLSELEALPEQISSQLGDTKMRKYLLNPNEWRNVLYDPATAVESQFRDLRGIDLRRNIHK